MGRERGGFRGRRRGPRPPRGRRPSGPREYTQTLPSDRDRMSMLTGESDPPFKSRYGGRDEYDPVDRDFNRQFDESPRGRQPWDSDPRGNPLERDPLEGYDTQGGRDVSRPTGRGIGSLGNVPPRVDSRPPRNKARSRRTGFYDTYSGDKGPFATGKDGYSGDMGPFAEAGPIMGAIDMGRPVDTGRKYYSNQDLKNMRGDPVSDVELERRKMFNEPLRQEYDDSSIKQRLRDLENRKPQITPATQDLSGITGRLSELEGRQPSWQEDRIKALEGRKPDTSWKDPLSTLQTGQQQGQQARTALDQRLAALEDYYKKDPPPPPGESTGNRYEDKKAQYAKQWEVTPYDPEASRWEGSKQKWGDYGEETWARELPEIYKRNMRALNREYNKPTYEATIKGRDYKAYGYEDKERLKMLDQKNIHEDEYLGSGTWTNKWGEQITGQKRGEQPRYFTSHSGLDPQSQEYKDRFRKDQKWISSRPGADYSWRGDDKGYEYRSHYAGSNTQDIPFENEFLHGNRIVKTKGGQDYLWPNSNYS